MKKDSRQALILLAALAPMALCVQCSGLNGWVQVRNPFQEETTAFKEMMENRSQRPVTNPRQPVSETASAAAPEVSPSRVYFGGDPIPDRSGTGPKKPTAVDEIASPRTVKARSNTGTICYRCNGKGYTMQFSQDGSGNELPCPDCAGAGRR
jgi:hypothetical protein